MHESMQRLYQLSGLSGAALGAALNESPQTITNWQKRGISKAGAIRAGAKFGASAEWLMTGVGLPPQDRGSNVEPASARMLPVLSWVQAGYLTRTEQISHTDIMEWYPEISSTDCVRCFYLRVTGISNYPEYQEGDLILVDPTVQPDQLNSGDMVVVRHDHDATFKRMVIEPGGLRYLQALNPQWTPNIIPFAENMELVGLVIDAVRPIGVPRRTRPRRH